MIGSGVFVTSGFALESLGSRLFVLAAWFVGGLCSQVRRLRSPTSLLPAHGLRLRCWIGDGERRRGLLRPGPARFVISRTLHAGALPARGAARRYAADALAGAALAARPDAGPGDACCRAVPSVYFFG